MIHSSASPECKSAHRALHDTLDVINGKWRLGILHLLLRRAWRFNELCRELSISPRVLSKELQDLELNQLIRRTPGDATRPATVVYESTAYSQTLTGVITAMRDWGHLHHATITGQPLVVSALADCAG